MAAPDPTGSGDDFSGNSGKISAIFFCGFLAIAIMLAMAEQLGAGSATVGLVLIAFTLMIYALIALVARTGSATEFFSGGRSMPARYTGMAVAASWTTAAAFTGMTGSLYALGFDGLATLIGMIAGLVLMAVLIVPYLRKLGAVTVADYFGVRFGAVPRLIAATITAVSLIALLVVQLSAIGFVASRFLGVPHEWAVIAACALLVLVALPGGIRGVIGTQAAQYIVLIIALLLPAAWFAYKALGWPLPHFVLGLALEQIAALEIGMIEKGAATADSMKPHASPFLQLDPLNFLATIFAAMGGVAVLPHLVTPYLTNSKVRDARLSVAWTAFFALLVAATLPAYAALGKLHVYRMIESGTAFADLPSWIEDASRQDLVRVHGVSMRTLVDAAAAVRAGAVDAGAVTTAVQSSAPGSATQFGALDGAVKSAIIDAAKSSGTAQLWDAYRQSVLPIAAKAAGNDTGKLTGSSLWIEPQSLSFVMPKMVGMPGMVSALIAAGAIAAALATASGVLFAIASAVGHDLYHTLLDRRATELRRLVAARLLVLAVAAGAGWLALHPPSDLATLASWTFSLAASGLLPALVLGIWSKRTNAWGAAAGMIAGFGACIAYMIGSLYFPAEMQGILGTLASASDSSAESIEPGPATAFGFPSSSAAIFAVPLGFLITALVSVITPKPWPETLSIIEEMRKPKGDAVLGLSC